MAAECIPLQELPAAKVEAWLMCWSWMVYAFGQGLEGMEHKATMTLLSRIYSLAMFNAIEEVNHSSKNDSLLRSHTSLKVCTRLREVELSVRCRCAASPWSAHLPFLHL